MSLGLIKKNSSSPFRLQRSIVEAEDGAYARGGFNPDALYNNDAANAAVESIGKVVGAALTARGEKEESEKTKAPEKPKPPKNTEKAAKATKIIEDTFDPFGLNKIDPSKWKR